MTAGTIYKLLTRAEWEAAQAGGIYRGSAQDGRDGFIHFSTAAQLGETARKHFAGVGDLVLLAVEVEALEKTPSPQPSPARGEGAGRAYCEEVPEVTGHPPLPSRERGRGEGEEKKHALRWELSRGGDLFPHLYAELPLSAVKSVTPITLAEDGTPTIPPGLAP